MIELDDDAAARLEAEARRTQKTVEELGNDAVREKYPTASTIRKPFRIDGPFVRSRPGIQMTRVEEVLDEVEGPLRK
ncbi:MAG: hypothetical protein DMF56_17705 [Acidobacteria bacterium]|nr:MAG: hypothetical protein DMF56_17705 [Acidobacteriota bacterium]